MSRTSVDVTAEPPTSADPISLAAYARMRGVSREAVSVAVKKGRLQASVGRLKGRPAIIDVDLADREWAASTDLSKAPGYVKERAAPVAEHVELLEYSLPLEAAREKHWRANLAELEYRTQAGELIEASEVAARFTEVVSVAKTKLLGIAARVRQRLPQLTADDVRVVDDLVREALEGLADGTQAEGEQP